MSIADLLDKIIQIDEFKNYINPIDFLHLYTMITMYGLICQHKKGHITKSHNL